MRILLSNDDGYQALGIQVLKKVLVEHGHDVYIVAPSCEQSGASHAMSFFKPVMVRKIEDKVYSVYGTPADSVAIGLVNILQDCKPDLVISGINNGYNVGRDVNYSGTIGAATEAALEGYKAIAVSMGRISEAKREEHAAAALKPATFVAKLINNLIDIKWPTGEVLNINYPASAPKGVRLVSSNSTSLYEPFLDKLSPQNTADKGLNIFIIGGDMHKEAPNTYDDAAYIHQGYVVLSYIQARQSSTAHTSLFTDLLPELETYIKS